MSRHIAKAVVAMVTGMTLVATGSVRVADAAQGADPGAIDALRASDAELNKAVAELDHEVAAQQVAVAAAQQAVDAATQAVANDNQQMSDAQLRMQALKSAVAERAVEEYVRPHEDDVFGQLLESNGFSDASRRTALLDEVTNWDDDSLDQLRAVNSDLVRDRKAQDSARRLSAERHNQAQIRLDQVNASRAEKVKLDQSLQDRIQSALGEDAASAADPGTSSSSQGRASRGGDSGPADESRLSAAGMQWPVAAPHPIRSPYGWRWGSLHAGIDIGVPENTPIHPVMAGKIIFEAQESGYGNIIKIDNYNGVETWYAHQNHFDNHPVGSTVSPSDVIGYVGHTGFVVPPSAAGAHLHFEVHINGATVDPLDPKHPYLP